MIRKCQTWSRPSAGKNRCCPSWLRVAVCLGPQIMDPRDLGSDPSSAIFVISLVDFVLGALASPSTK